MNAEFTDHDHHHQLGDSATRPSRPRWVTLAALLLLAGISPQRRRPCRVRLRLQAQTVSQAGSRLPEFPAQLLPAHPIAAYSGAFNCRF